MERDFSRRQILKAGLRLGTGAVVLNGCDLLPVTEPIKSPEIVLNTPTEFGFNTHVYTDDIAGNMNLDTFEDNVGRLVDANQKWIRFNMVRLALPESTKDEINWSDALSLYEDAINYAKDKGLKIHLVTESPGFAAELSQADYLNAIKIFYGELARRFKGKVSVWQIFNEPDMHDFKSYDTSKDVQFDLTYVNELSRVITEASGAIKKEDPESKITMNLSHWIVNNTDIIKKGTIYFDLIAKSLDVLTLDLYPDLNEEEMKKYPSYVEYFTNRYKKGVIIGELGLPNVGDWTEEVQGKYIAEAIDYLKSGIIQPQAVIIYELMDEDTPLIEDPVEKRFGFIDKTGKPKASFNLVISEMQTDDTENKES